MKESGSLDLRELTGEPASPSEGWLGQWWIRKRATWWLFRKDLPPPPFHAKPMKSPTHPRLSFGLSFYSAACFGNPKEALISGNRFTHPHSNCSQTCKPQLLISSSTGQDSRAFSKMQFALISTDFLSPLTRYPVGLQSSLFYLVFYGLESTMGKEFWVSYSCILNHFTLKGEDLDFI